MNINQSYLNPDYATCRHNASKNRGAQKRSVPKTLQNVFPAGYSTEKRALCLKKTDANPNSSPKGALQSRRKRIPSGICRGRFCRRPRAARKDGLHLLRKQGDGNLLHQRSRRLLDRNRSGPVGECLMKIIYAIDIHGAVEIKPIHPSVKTFLVPF